MRVWKKARMFERIQYIPIPAGNWKVNHRDMSGIVSIMQPIICAFSIPPGLLFFCLIWVRTLVSIDVAKDKRGIRSKTFASVDAVPSDLSVENWGIAPRSTPKTVKSKSRILSIASGYFAAVAGIFLRRASRFAIAADSA